MVHLPGYQIVFLAPTLSQLDSHQQHAIPIRRARSRPIKSAGRQGGSEEGSEKRARYEIDSLEKSQDRVVENEQSPMSKVSNLEVLSDSASGQILQGKNASSREGPFSGGILTQETSVRAVSERNTSHQQSQNASENVEEVEGKGEINARSYESSVTFIDIQTDEGVPIGASELNAMPKLMSKRDLLRLGPARAVGMRRIAAHDPPLLKALARPKVNFVMEASKSDYLTNQSCQVSVASKEGEDVSVEESLIDNATTTAESIPPPPTHEFSLSFITTISNLLSTPKHYLSTHQGGDQFEGPLRFNILALVMRVGGLEDAPDWKAGGGKRMDRCEIVVKDASKCALKIVLEGECASRWATPREEVSLEGQNLHSYESSTDPGQQSDVSSEKYCNSLEASISALQDASTSASRTTIERQKDDQLLPLRSGDVIVLSRLYLVRPRQQGQHRSSSLRFKDGKAISTHAVASPAYNAHLEICWRNAIHHERDQRRNFDECLTLFDARCKAIYRLAQEWSGSSQ